jgi:SAM-dependent methyltransferase
MGYDFLFQHHCDLVRLFLENAPKSWVFKNKTFCEVGPSDCLSIASLLIGLGAAHVDLVEPSAPVVNETQLKVLEQIKAKGFDLDTSILLNGQGLSLDTSRITYHNSFMDALKVENKYDYLFSHHVMEHVEGLEKFYRDCWRCLKPGGQMFHCIDFSGHSELEDPVPPLDFQTYPNWLYHLMYPPFYRATRAFPSEHFRAMKTAGLLLDEVKVTRKADQKYLDQIWPELRQMARKLPREEISILEAVVVSHKE